MSIEDHSVSKVERDADAEESETVNMLKAAGISLAGRFNAFEGASFDQLSPLPPNTWNEHSGVILFSDHTGELYAVPSTDRYRDALYNDPRLVKDESIGVPQLGNPEIWHANPNEGQKIPGFQEWAVAKRNADTIIESERAEMQALGEEYKV